MGCGLEKSCIIWACVKLVKVVFSMQMFNFFWVKGQFLIQDSSPSPSLNCSMFYYVILYCINTQAQNAKCCVCHAYWITTATLQWIMTAGTFFCSVCLKYDDSVLSEQTRNKGNARRINNLLWQTFWEWHLIAFCFIESSILCSLRCYMYVRGERITTSSFPALLTLEQFLLQLYMTV